MQKRELAKGAVLWWHGEAAQSIGVVEAGLLGMRTEVGLVGVAFPGTVVGEAAILAHDGPHARRRAAVFALEDATVVTEYPVSMVKDSFGVGVPRKVLRTLIAQICGNLLVTLAAGSPDGFSEACQTRLAEAMLRSEASVHAAGSWEPFLESLRLLQRLRDLTSETVRERVPPEALTDDLIVRAGEMVKGLLNSPDEDPLARIESFVRYERERARPA